METPRKPQETILDLLKRARAQSEDNLRLAIKRSLPDTEKAVRKRLADLDHAIGWIASTSRKAEITLKTSLAPTEAQETAL